MGEVTPRQAARAAYLAAGFNLAAVCATLLLLKPGLPVPGSDASRRAAFLRDHVALWRTGWIVWQAAAISLVAFFLALARLFRGRAPLLTAVAVSCATAGLAADLGAESVFMAVAPGLEPEALLVVEKAGVVLTGYLGNGLYTLAGVLLAWAGRRDIPGGLLALSVPVWLAGAALSASSLLGWSAGQVAATALLMPLFVLWAALVGRWLGRGRPIAGV